MKMGIASDHGGYELKEAIKAKFKDIEWQDYGTNSTESVDYPGFIQKLCEGVLGKEVQLSIALCGTGIGASITANRFKGIRAALCHNQFTAEMARKHNDANMLVLGARVLSEAEAFSIIETYLGNEFEGGRHQRRLDAIEMAQQAGS